MILIFFFFFFVLSFSEWFRRILWKWAWQPSGSMAVHREDLCACYWGVGIFNIGSFSGSEVLALKESKLWRVKWFTAQHCSAWLSSSLVLLLSPSSSSSSSSSVAKRCHHHHQLLQITTTTNSAAKQMCMHTLHML